MQFEFELTIFLDLCVLSFFACFHVRTRTGHFIQRREQHDFVERLQRRCGQGTAVKTPELKRFEPTHLNKTSNWTFLNSELLKLWSQKWGGHARGRLLCRWCELWIQIMLLSGHQWLHLGCIRIRSCLNICTCKRSKYVYAHVLYNFTSETMLQALEPQVPMVLPTLTRQDLLTMRNTTLNCYTRHLYCNVT